MYMEKDGWRNEDTEGPYVDTLRTLHIKGNYWEIYRYINADMFSLSKNNTFINRFATVEEAKKYVKSQELL